MRVDSFGSASDYSGSSLVRHDISLKKSLYWRNFSLLCVFLMEFLSVTNSKFNSTLGKFLGAPSEISITKFSGIQLNLSKCVELDQFVN